LHEISRAAEVIADVTVQAVTPYWATPSGAEAFRTKVIFKVNRAVKGNPGPTLTLVFLGGEVGERALKIPGVPEFEVGGRYVLFSESPDKAVVCPLLGMDQGALRVVHDKESDADRVFRHWGQPVNASEPFESHKPVIAGITTRDYLRTADTVDRFLERVRDNP
jgi:hypothetical protein